MSLSLQWAQFIAIARCEMKLLWRARLIPIVLLGILALSVLNVMTLNSSGRITLESMLANYSNPVSGHVQAVIFLVWSPLGSILALMTPLFVADTIPRDTYTGVRELAESLPVSVGTYLNGKIAGICGLLIAGVSLIAVITGLLWAVNLGAYNPMPYLVMVVLGLWSLILMNGGLGVLLTATQPTRRRAIGIVILLLIVPAMLALDQVVSIYSLPGMLLPTRRVILLYFMQLSITETHLYIAIIVGLLEAGFMWLMVRTWLNWRIQHR